MNERKKERKKERKEIREKDECPISKEKGKEREM